MKVLKKYKIVIIDSSRSLVKVIRKSLPTDEVSILYTPSSITGIQMIHKVIPDIVIVDSLIDEFSGFDIVSYIKNTKELKKIFVIMFSSVISEQNILYSNYISIDYYAVKGETSIEILSKTCSEILSKRKVSNVSDNAVPDSTDIGIRIKNLQDIILMQNLLEREIFDIAKEFYSLESVIEKFFTFLMENFNITVSALMLSTRNKNNFFEKSLVGVTKEQIETALKKIKAVYFEQNENVVDENIAVYQRRFGEFKSAKNAHNVNITGENTFEYYFEGCYVVLYLAHTLKYDDEYKYLMYSLTKFEILLKTVWAYHEQKSYANDIRYAFSKFLPEKIISELIQKKNIQDMMKGEKRNIAVFFSHVRDFHKIETSNSAEAVVNFLNNHFTLCSESIKEHGGEINKYIDDAIFAMFGAPESYENNVERAVRAAIEILVAVSSNKLNVLFLENTAGDFKYRIGVGIHIGDVIIGNIGSSDSFDYTAIGDTINLAARLESLNKYYDTDVLFTEEVKNAVEKYNLPFIYREVDNIKVKGKESATKVFTVVIENSLSEEFIKLYNKGLKMSFLGNWNLALNFFKSAAALFPDDKITAIHIGRCNNYIENPPEKWDGAFKLDFK